MEMWDGNVTIKDMLVLLTVGRQTHPKTQSLFSFNLSYLVGLLVLLSLSLPH